MTKKEKNQLHKEFIHDSLRFGLGLVIGVVFTTFLWANYMHVDLPRVTPLLAIPLAGASVIFFTLPAPK